MRPCPVAVPHDCPARARALAHAIGELIPAGLGVAEAVPTATSGTAQACGAGGRKGRLTPGYDG
jgi:imidazolonepropionase-like amidohydrolase